MNNYPDEGNAFAIFRISLNPTKSDYLIISPTLSESPAQNFNNIPLSTSKRVKYLGVYLNSELNIHDHITATEQKKSRAVGIMSKLKPEL